MTCVAIFHQTIFPRNIFCSSSFLRSQHNKKFHFLVLGYQIKPLFDAAKQLSKPLPPYYCSENFIFIERVEIVWFFAKFEFGTFNI